MEGVQTGDAAPVDRHVRGRVLIALAASAGVGVLVDRSVALLMPGTYPNSMIAGAIAACIVGIVAIGRAIAPLHRDRKELQHAYAEALAEALRDPLTGLGNHRAFQEELERQVEHAIRYEMPLALVVLDLDDFKAINDNDGHAGGDRALAGMGRLLATSLRKGDRPFRVGGDEFAILLPNTDATGAHIVARRVLATSLSPPIVGNRAPIISFSAGVSSFPELAANRTQLYSQADAAMYVAKRGGRTDVAIFDPMLEAASDGSSGSGIADVLARNLLRPVYQPIVELGSGHVIGYEGLIRPVAPAPFGDPVVMFAAAEAAGRLTQLDMACIETLLAGAADLAPDQFLSLNLSPHTLEAPEFSSVTLLSVLARHGLSPERLVLELTEHQPIADVERARTRIDSLRRAGIRMAADDVGAGNAGLRLLSELPFDLIKVDLSIVRRSTPGAPSGALLRSVAEFGARTGALVIAEGIEEEWELDQVVELGARAGQGYLLGMPGPLPHPDAGTNGPIGPDRMADWRSSVGLPSTAIAPSA